MGTCQDRGNGKIVGCLFGFPYKQAPKGNFRSVAHIILWPLRLAEDDDDMGEGGEGMDEDEAFWLRKWQLGKWFKQVGKLPIWGDLMDSHPSPR